MPLSERTTATKMPASRSCARAVCAVEREQLDLRFSRVLANYLLLLKKQKNLVWFTNFFGQAAMVFPFVVVGDQSAESSTARASASSVSRSRAASSCTPSICSRAMSRMSVLVAARMFEA